MYKNLFLKNIMKLAVFDFDNTLMNWETIDFLALENWVIDEVSKITKKSMAWELNFYESLINRVKLLKWLSLQKVNSICANLPLNKWVEETLIELKKRGYKIICFSWWFRNATKILVEKWLVDVDFANILNSKNWVLTWEVWWDMMFAESKWDMLRRLQWLLGINKKDTIVIWDWANDLSMFKFADKKIAFCANKILKDKANIIIEEKDLSLILDYIN